MLKQAETKALKLEDRTDAKLAAPSPEAKRACTELEKKLKKLPAGNLQLAKECTDACQNRIMLNRS